MLRVACAIVIAAVGYGAVSAPANAAPIAPPSAAATHAGGVIPVHYWHGRYYPYRWHGRYYHHRRWGHGHWRYW